MLEKSPAVTERGYLLFSNYLNLYKMVFTNFEEFLDIRLDSSFLEQWSNDLELNEMLNEFFEEGLEEDEEDEE
jgi:hypothetical protein